MEDKKILIIHPLDKTTQFLNRIKNHLFKNFKNKIHVFNIQRTETSHEQCLQKIRDHSAKGLIIFLGHGRSDKLFGSKGDNYNAIVDEEIQLEHPQDYYYKQDFITPENADVFKDKKVFCLACNSNEKIAKCAIEKGARSFVGFGDIPTSYDEFMDKNQNVHNSIVPKIKAELVYIIKKGLDLAIQNNCTLKELESYIDFITSQHIAYILADGEKFADRYKLADNLYFIKKSIAIFGSSSIPIIE